MIKIILSIIITLTSCSESVLSPGNNPSTNYQDKPDSALILTIHSDLGVSNLDLPENKQIEWRDSLLYQFTVTQYHPGLNNIDSIVLLFVSDSIIDPRFFDLNRVANLSFYGEGITRIPDNIIKYPGYIGIIHRDKICADTDIQFIWLKNRYPGEEWKFCAS